MNIIYIRNNKVWLPEEANVLPDRYIVSLLKNMEALGFGLSKPAVERVRTLSLATLEKFYHQLINDLRALVGAHVPFEPMYPDFPRQVMEAPDEELYANALLHYFGDAVGLRIMPDYARTQRMPLLDQTSLRILQLGTTQDFEDIFTQLAGSNTSLSVGDKQHVTWYVSYFKDDIIRMMPAAIPQKENLAYLGAQLLLHTTLGDQFLQQHCKTATDVLRVAVAMADGDVSLAENTKFKKLSKRQRKMLLHLLEQSSCALDDMLRYKEVWKRLGEKLHPFDYEKRFPRSCQAFDVLRNDKPYETYYGRIDRALKQRDFAAAISTLAERPGELARRLDHLLRTAPDAAPVLDAFNRAAAKVSTPVLLQLLTHFRHRHTPPELRVFFPKGNASKVFGLPYNLPQLPETHITSVVSICKQHLVERFKPLPPLGKTFLSEELKNYTVPFAMRSASKALKTLSRGSRFSLPAGNTLRFFLWWRDGRGRTDIDLSALGLDNQHRLKYTLAYYNLKELGGYHSGDITSAPEGASEFIDIEIDKFLEAGVRYVAMSINSFTAQPFCDLPECFAGLMVRQYPNSGEVYDPRTVHNKIDIGANTRACIPMIIDLKTKEVIWTDLGLTHVPDTNNTANTLPVITVMTKAMTSLVKMSLYELFELHVQARGEFVLEKEKADTIFAVDEGITPFDTQTIASKFL
jgi:stress response protein SCP2